MLETLHAPVEAPLASTSRRRRSASPPTSYHSTTRSIPSTPSEKSEDESSSSRKVDEHLELVYGEHISPPPHSVQMKTHTRMQMTSRQPRRPFLCDQLSPAVLYHALAAAPSQLMTRCTTLKRFFWELSHSLCSDCTPTANCRRYDSRGRALNMRI